MSRRDYFKKENTEKKIAITFGIIFIVTMVAFIAIFTLYNKKLQEEAEQSILELGAINAIVPNNISSENISAVSSTTDRGINEVINETIDTGKNTVENNDTVKKLQTTEAETEEITEEIGESGETVSEIEEAIGEEMIVEQEPVELSFMAPVSGEIIKDFASDTLLYSKTLDEWIVHNGIDIKADKTSVVVASEAGTVESIKNDPRYGLTITIAHANGYKTIYANLLSSEFVSEGDIVEKGQTIGTVGESASFEVADDPHLHFEMTLDGEYVNPTIYFE